MTRQKQKYPASHWFGDVTSICLLFRSCPAGLMVLMWRETRDSPVFVFMTGCCLKTGGFIEPKNTTWWITLRRGVGEACRVPRKKIALFRMFPLFYLFCSLFFFLIQNFFFFLPRSRLSISDVDFIIRFLKRWYFFQDKRRKTSHYECVSVAGNVSELVTNL